MSALSVVCLAVLVASAAVAAAAAVRRRNLVDRVIGLDTMVAILLNGLAVYIAGSDEPLAVDLMLAIATLAFLGTVTVARYVERRGT